MQFLKYAACSWVNASNCASSLPAKCEEIIPINTVVMATRIINPILDDANIIDEAYILDIYAKSKGDGKSE